MKHGKHYIDAAKQVDSTKLYDVNEALELAARSLPPSSMRPSSCTSVWALTAVTLTSRSAAPSCYPTHRQDRPCVRHRQGPRCLRC